jgi:hypothetical protein
VVRRKEPRRPGLLPWRARSQRQTA